MKTYNRPATSILVANFDATLKQLLTEDLKALKGKNISTSNNQSASQQQAA